MIKMSQTKIQTKSQFLMSLNKIINNHPKIPNNPQQMKILIKQIKMKTIKTIQIMKSLITRNHQILQKTLIKIIQIRKMIRIIKTKKIRIIKITIQITIPVIRQIIKMMMILRTNLINKIINRMSQIKIRIKINHRTKMTNLKIKTPINLKINRMIKLIKKKVIKQMWINQALIRIKMITQIINNNNQVMKTIKAIKVIRKIKVILIKKRTPRNKVIQIKIMMDHKIKIRKKKMIKTLMTKIKRIIMMINRIKTQIKPKIKIKKIQIVIMLLINSPKIIMIIKSFKIMIKKKIKKAIKMLRTKTIKIRINQLKSMINLC